MSSKKGKDRGKPVADQPAAGAAVPGAADQSGALPVPGLLPDPALPAGENTAAVVSPTAAVDGAAAGHAEPVPPAAAPAEPPGTEDADGSIAATQAGIDFLDDLAADTGGDIGQAAETGGEGGTDTAAPGSGDPDVAGLQADPRAEWPLDAGIPTDNDPAVPDAETGDAAGADPAGGSGGGADDVDLDDVLTGFGIADMARSAAATARLYAAKGQAVRFEDVFTVEDAQIMADFVRDNPEAPVDAMAIHLGLKKRAPRAELSPVDRFALKLFHQAVMAAIAFDKEVKAIELEKIAHGTTMAGRYPGLRSFTREPAPFSPTGFRPLR